MTINSLANTVEVLFNEKKTEKSVGLDVIKTDVRGLSILRTENQTSFESIVYTPLICLILQGSKEIASGDESALLTAGTSLIIGHDLPVSSRIIHASSSQPYLSLVFTLDIEIIRSLYGETGETQLNSQPPQALGVGTVEAQLLDAFQRLISIADNPIETKVIAPLITREIHFRLLRAEHGTMLRQLLRRDSHASQISKAISWLGSHYAATLNVPDLADTVGMSVSSFYQHFKSVTATTPLQYQKELRLIRAQNQLRGGAHSVSSVAYEVGYESVSQFSREYLRKFKINPSAEIAKK